MIYFNKNIHLKIKNVLKCNKIKYNFFYLNISNYTNENFLTENKLNEIKTSNDLLNILYNNKILINEIGKFELDKKKNIYDRILYKPKDFNKLFEFINILKKNKIKNDFDIYFYDEDLENFKLNRDQNKVEIFIDLKNISNKNIKISEQIHYLQEIENIKSLYFYNIQRYNANVDPSSFLVDRKRLTKDEYTYQYISTILPILSFTFMLLFPHLLICLLIPYIKNKNKKQKQLCQILQKNQNIYIYKDIKPEQIINLIDNNINTIIFFYNSKIFFNTYLKSLLIDLSKIFINNYISIQIVGIDTSKYNAQKNVISDLNDNLFPLIYFILPYHYDNDSAVIKLEEPFSIQNIISQIADFVHIPSNIYNQIKQLDINGNKLKTCVFENEIFKNNDKENIIYDYGTEVAYLFCSKSNDKL